MISLAIRRVIIGLVTAAFTGGVAWAFAVERRVSVVEAKVEDIRDDVRATRSAVTRLENFLIGKHE